MNKFQQFLPDAHQNLVVETVPLNDIRRTYCKRFEDMVNNANIADSYRPISEICVNPDKLTVCIYCEDYPMHSEPVYREFQSLMTMNKFFTTRMQSIPDAVFVVDKSQIFKSVHNKKKRKGSEMHLYFRFTGSVISEIVWRNAETSLEMNFAVNSLSSLASSSESFTKNIAPLNSSSNSLLNVSQIPEDMKTTSSLELKSATSLETEVKREELNKKRKVREGESTEMSINRELEEETVTDQSKVSAGSETSQFKKKKLNKSRGNKGNTNTDISNASIPNASNFALEESAKEKAVEKPIFLSSLLSNQSSVNTSSNAPLPPSFLLDSSEYREHVKIGSTKILLPQGKSNEGVGDAFLSNAIATKATDFSLGVKVKPKPRTWRGVVILHLNDEHKIERIVSKYISEDLNP